MAVLNISLCHFWIDVGEDVFQELSSFFEIVVEHLGADVGVLNVNRFFVVDVGKTLRREIIEAVVKEEVGED